MKRFVSYLYSIYNNQKIHNAGFARMELRPGRNRVDIHLKENGYAGKTGTVYLFIRKQENIQGISIGNITFRGNQADFRYEQAEENIGQTPWQIMQMNGIMIMIEDRAAFLSQWDEQPVDTTRLEVWNIDKLEGEGEGQHNQADQRAEHMSSRAAGTESERKLAASQSEVAKRSSAGQPEIAKRSSADQSEIKKGASAGAAIIQAEAGKEPVSAVQSGNGKIPGLTIQVSNEKIPGSTIQPENQDVSTSTIQRKEESVSTPAMQSEVRTPSATQAGGSDAGDGYAASSGGQTEPEGALEAEQQMNIRTAELQPQARNAGNQTWRYMLRTYPVLNQFTDKNNVLCVRIEIKDIRLLPEKYWSMVNNSFLLHGFFNYRYLAFGRIDQNWFLGIPGIYQNQEHVMASIFGFPDFLPQNQKNDRGEQPGYWYRILEI